MKEKYNIVVLGDAKVGKTALVKTLMDDDKPSVPTDDLCVTREKKLKRPDKNHLMLQLCDMSGNRTRYEFNYPMYAQKADMIFLVWDASRPETFDALSQYLKILKDVPTHIPVIFIRNKSDINERDNFKARQETIGQWMKASKRENFCVVEISAKRGYLAGKFKALEENIAAKLQEKSCGRTREARITV